VLGGPVGKQMGGGWVCKVVVARFGRGGMCFFIMLRTCQIHTMLQAELSCCDTVTSLNDLK
jgi:hypothetical protein